MPVAYLMINIIYDIFNLAVLGLQLNSTVFGAQFEIKNLNLHVNIGYQDPILTIHWPIVYLIVS